VYLLPEIGQAMSRSERYIPPSDEEMERMRKARKTAEQFDRNRIELLRKALKRTKKAELVDIILRVAQAEKANEWVLENEIRLDKPVDLLVHDIASAVDIATKVDKRRLNYNFDYDWRAYAAVRRGLSELIQKDAIEEAKNLALKLINKGSYQMECSDEGLMQEEIEDCLRPVIDAVANLPGSREWASEMLKYDRMGCLCEQELRKMAGPTRGPVRNLVSGSGKG
jgi:hypothetical protein